MSSGRVLLESKVSMEENKSSWMYGNVQKKIVERD
jgi:hypothetical protein